MKYPLSIYVGYISLPDLGRIIQIKMKDKSSRIELERAFQLMDKEAKGFISIVDLRRVAKDIGEIISEEEMQVNTIVLLFMLSGNRVMRMLTLG